MGLTLGGKVVSDASQLRTLLTKNPKVLSEVVPQLDPELRAEVEQLGTSYFGGATDQQVALLLTAADDIIAYADTGKAQKSREGTLLYETFDLGSASSFGALTDAQRTVTVDGPTGQIEWTLVSPDEVTYRKAGSSAASSGPVPIGGLAGPYEKGIASFRDELVAKYPFAAKPKTTAGAKEAPVPSGPKTAAPGEKVEKLRYGASAAFGAEELKASWKKLSTRGEPFESYRIPADLSAELVRALKRVDLVPSGQGQKGIESVMRGVWFGGGPRVQAFFKSVMSKPEQLAKVLSNLRAYNQVAETSNFDPMFPNVEAPPTELLQRAAVVGFFARDNGLRRELAAAIEGDLREQGAARVESRKAGSPRLDVAVLGSGPTGTAFATSLQGRIADDGTPARVAVFDKVLNGTFRLGASWRLNSPSRESENKPGVPGSGDINYLSNIASVSDAEGGFWSSAEPVSQAAAIDLYLSQVPVELDSSIESLARSKDGGYVLEFKDGTTQVSDTVIIGAGLGRQVKLFGDPKTDKFVTQEHALNDEGGVDRAFDFLYADSLQLFEMTQGLNVPMQPFAPKKSMTLDELKAVGAKSSSPIFKQYLANATKLAPGQALKNAKVRPQQVVAVIGAGDGGKTVVELLTLLGPGKEADRTPSQLGIRPQLLWFVGGTGPKDCTEFYVGQLEEGFAGMQKTLDTDPELKDLGIDVFQLLKNKSLQAADAAGGDPQAYLTASLQFFEQFLGVVEPREMIKDLFPKLTGAQLIKVEQAYFKARDAVRPRYNQLVQPIAKGQIKLVADRVDALEPTNTPLGELLTVKGANGEKYLVDRVIATVGNENGTEEVLAPLIEGKKGKLPVLKDPKLFEYIQVTDPDGESTVVGKRLIEDPGVIFLGPGAIADFQKNETAVGANTVSIFLNKPLNDLAAEDIAQGLKLAETERTKEERETRATEDAAFAEKVRSAAQDSELPLKGTSMASVGVNLPARDERLRNPVADRGPVAFDVALNGLLSRVRGPGGGELSLSIARGSGRSVTVYGPENVAKALITAAQNDPVISENLLAIEQGDELRIQRTFLDDGRVSLERGAKVTEA